MNRRKFLKMLSALLGTATISLCDFGSSETPQIEMGTWRGVRWITRYKRFEFPPVLAEGEMWGVPRLEFERVQMTYKKYQAALRESL